MTPLEEAAARLEAYERVVRIAAGRDGEPRPPVLELDDERLQQLFAARAREALVDRPFRGEGFSCG